MVECEADGLTEGLAGDEWLAQRPAGGAEEREYERRLVAAVKRPPERRIVREAGGLVGDEAEGRDAAGEAAAGAEDRA